MHQQNTFAWSFEVTSVRQGHDCVSTAERSDAKKLGAKLTFGEVTECGVSQMLQNLGALRKRTFHDLGCGSAKMIIQTYLQCPNLVSCLGIELAPGRYQLAQNNLKKLVHAGFQGRQFLVVEFQDMEFLKVVECENVQNKNFSLGQTVVAFHPSLRTLKSQVINYSAVILSNSENGYSVQYSNGRIIENLEAKYIFSPERVRTLELIFGNIFHFPRAWNCEVCILETDFPQETHQALMEGMSATPIGCTFLTYHDLKGLASFRPNLFRQLDINVYDNDRLPTSWSQGWRFYCWERIVDTNKKLAPDDISLLRDVQFVTVKFNDSTFVVKIVERDQANRLILGIPQGGSTVETFNPMFVPIYSPGFRFDMGTEVCAYWPANVSTEVPSQYDVFFGVVDGISPLGYTIRYSDGDLLRDVNPCWVFRRPTYLFQVGDRVSACWPPNAQNKNCPERYVRFPGFIRGQNTDGTYEIEYFDGLKAHHVREMWIKPMSQKDFHSQRNQVTLPPDPSKVYEWNSDTVCRWVRLLGLNSLCVAEFRRSGITGRHLINLTQNDIYNFNFSKKEAQLLINKIFRLKNPVEFDAIKIRRAQAAGQFN